MSLKIYHTNDIYQIKYFNSGLYKHTSKTFNRSKPNPELKVLDFILTLTSDRYITACPREIYEFAVDHDHDVLREKSWEFLPELAIYYNKQQKLKNQNPQ